MTEGQPEGDRDALDRLLGVPEMAWLVARVRGRIIAAGGEPLRGVVQLTDPSPAQRAAAVRLVGRPRRAGATLRVDLAVVEEILRRGPWPAGLADAVQMLGGPVVDYRAVRERERGAWDRARDGLGPALNRFPRLGEWWQAWCAAGGLKRITGAEAARLSVARSPVLAADLVSQVAGVLDVLPAAGEPLAVLARQTVGDAHGLDAARPLGRLTAAVVRAAFVPDAVEGDWSTRDTWAAAGVVMSNVASTVLCLGVAGAGVTGIRTTDADLACTDEADTGLAHTARSATAAALEAMRSARMPVLLTLDQVRSGGVRPVPPDANVHVCENPSVVEVVAARWMQSAAAAPQDQGLAVDQDASQPPGTTGPVLVCTSGQPSTAVVELLQALAADGARVRYHGDFDWAGLRIARSLGAHVAWEPWRYRAADYRAALADGWPSRDLTGSPAPSPWDPDLAAAMTHHGLAVEEEAVAHLLAADLLSR